MELCTVNEITVGDVVDGPDGRSTVVSKRQLPGVDMLQLDFAEGKGNRCWSALRPTEKITRLERTDLDMPLGFVVNRKNEVVLSGVFEVVDKGNTLEVHYFTSTLVTETKMFNKKDVNRLMGEYIYTLFTP